MTEPINRESDPRWAILGAYVRDVADRMGLGLYHFDLEHDAPNSVDSLAQVAPAPGCLRFRIWFGDDFFSCCPKDQRRLVVHELGHVIMNQTIACLDVLKDEDCISTQLWNHFERQHAKAQERQTDWLAALLAPSMPLIEWESTDA